MLRRQLTLFVPPAASVALEALRAQLDPVQHALIAAHVTLCREDELEDWDAIARRIAALAPMALTLSFGAPRGFFEHGILMDCIDGAERFHALRMAVQGREDIPHQAAHITLAHPRNPRAPGNAPGASAAIALPLHVTFDTITLIEQDGAQPWRRLAAFAIPAWGPTRYTLPA